MHKAREVNEYLCARICGNFLFFLNIHHSSLLFYRQIWTTCSQHWRHVLPINRCINKSLKCCYEVLNVLVDAFEILRYILPGWLNIIQLGVLPPTRRLVLQPTANLEMATSGTNEEFETSHHVRELAEILLSVPSKEETKQTALLI